MDYDPIESLAETLDSIMSAIVSNLYYGATASTYSLSENIVGSGFFEAFNDWQANRTGEFKHSFKSLVNFVLDVVTHL